jgi:hypothetical protein
VARGEHLFEIADCAGCHSERDFSRWSGPIHNAVDPHKPVKQG